MMDNSERIRGNRLLRATHNIAVCAIAVATLCAGALAQENPKPPAPKKAAQKAPKTQGVDQDRINKILSSLDPKKFHLSEDLETEVVGDKIIVRGNENDVAVVKLLVALLEETEMEKEVRVVTVTEKDAKDIASNLEPILGEIFDKPNQREEQKLSITALSSNILLVSALPENIDWIVDLIKKVDETKEELPEPEQMVFMVKHRKATDVADELKDIVGKLKEKVGATGAKNEIQIIANNANNSIMVLAPESEREKIQVLLNQIDVEPVPGWGEVKLVLFPLLHSKAKEMQGVISDLLKTPEGKDAAKEVIHRLQISKALPTGEVVDLPPIDLQKPTKILSDDGTNSLIVATVEENVGPLGELIRLMDGVPLAGAISMRLFPLRYADAKSVSDLIKSMTDGGGELTQDPDGSGTNAVPSDDIGKALVYHVGVYADVRTNTIIVTGRSEHLSLVESVIADLDKPATALKFPLRFITLEHTDAPKLGDIIQKLFDQRVQALEKTEAGLVAEERERVFLSVDERSNSIIVSASEENFEEIQVIAKQLDSKPARLFDQIRIITLERLTAKDMQQKLEDLWKRKAELRREEDLQKEIPLIAVDERSNSLIVAAKMDDFEEIQRLIDKLEAQPLLSATELYALRFADAEVLASMLDKLFQGMASGSESFKAPTILPDPRSNALVAAGTRDALERLSEMVKRLDVETGPLTAVFKVYPLAHASAGQLSQQMQKLFDSRAEGKDITRTPIVIMADEASNSLICSASQDDHVSISELLKLLDKPSNLAKQFEIFPLRKARATKVADELESLFKSTGGDSGGQRLDAIATQADERTNSVVVWASPAQMANVSEVIGRLDTSAPAVEMMVRVVQLKQALAQDFADLLQKTLAGEDAGSENEKAVILAWQEDLPDGKKNIRKLLRQDIKIEPDPRTNSLLIVAPSDSVAMLEAMIRDFDRIRPIRSELRLFPLVNSDAKTMADQLTELFQTDKGGQDGETKSQLVFGDTIGDFDVASVGQNLRFAADPRTNTLIAAGAEVDLRMAEELVRYLDSQAAETRVLDVIPAHYLPADEIASAIQGINEQEQAVLGEVDSEEANTRRMERQVSVEAVGNQDEGSSKLIIGTSRQRYQETMDMIKLLDRPEPQVRISVVIAEVTLTDDFEFGMEFAGQQLDFTKQAVVGPNGVIEGPDFDYVGGTQLGAAGLGLGGFNFTMTGEDFSFVFHALQQNSRLEILSRPTLLVRNGDEGKITIADQVPIVQSSQLNDTGSTNTSVGREDVGTVLTATPNISPDGYVTIKLTQEISNFSGENLQLTEGVSAPIFATREVDTNVSIRDGETVVIGGLITQRKSDGINKVPILGDLPWIGAAFRSTSTSETKTELLIAMSAEVLRTGEDAHRMSENERDNFVMPEWIRKSPLLEGLRIRPDEELMGPSSKSNDGKNPKTPGLKKRPDERQLYGPKPKIYGPTVTRPTSTTSKPREFGPKVVRNEQPLPTSD